MALNAEHRLFLVPNGTTCKVGDKDVVFYPVSAPDLLALMAIAGPITKALTTLLSEKGKDVRREIKDYKERPQKLIPGPEAEGDKPLEPTIESYVSVTDPINPTLATYRDEQRARAVDDIVKALTEQQTQIVVAKLLMSSMRNDFDRNPSNEDAVRFIGMATIPTLIQMLKGAVMANAGVLSPQVDRLFQKAKSFLDGSRSANGSVENPPSPPSPTSPAQTTIGSDSTT